MKNFSLRTFVVSTVIIVVIAFESFFEAFGNTTGEIKHNFFTKLSDISITVFDFPINYFFSKLDVETGFIIYFILLFINCLLYALLIERLFALVKNRKSKIPPVPTGI
jgi:hypothetical protein